jgi:hypothetical protein
MLNFLYCIINYNTQAVEGQSYLLDTLSVPERSAVLRYSIL